MVTAHLLESLFVRKVYSPKAQFSEGTEDHLLERKLDFIACNICEQHKLNKQQVVT